MKSHTASFIKIITIAIFSSICWWCFSAIEMAYPGGDEPQLIARDTVIFMDTMNINRQEAILSRVLVKKEMFYTDRIILDGEIMFKKKVLKEYNILVSDTFVLNQPAKGAVSASQCKTLKCMMNRMLDQVNRSNNQSSVQMVWESEPKAVIEAPVVNNKVDIAHVESTLERARRASQKVVMPPAESEPIVANPEKETPRKFNPKKQAQKDYTQETTTAIFQDVNNYGELLNKMQEVRYSYQKAYKKQQKANNTLVDQANGFLKRSIEQELLSYWDRRKINVTEFQQSKDSEALNARFFVNSVLEDAGFAMNRVKLTQLPMQKNMAKIALGAPVTQKRGYGGIRQFLEEKGTGLYIIGFRQEMGFLHYDGYRTHLIHTASYKGGSVVRIPLSLAMQFIEAENFSIFKLGENVDFAKYWIKNKRIK